VEIVIVFAVLTRYEIPRIERDGAVSPVNSRSFDACLQCAV